MPGIELNWPNKNRVLCEVPQRGQGKPVYYGDPGTPPWPDHRPLLRLSTHGDPDPDPDRLIQGDNLVALQALLDEGMAGRFKCICIDPPYNTGSAFTHYDDGYENTIWLGMMRDRVKMLYKLLAEDGSLWIFIDDNQAHYLKIACDEVFGRGNFVTAFIWRKVDSPNDNKVPLTPDHEYVLCYEKTLGAARFKQKDDSSILNAYSNRDEQGRLYRDRLLKKNGKNSLRQDRPTMYFPVSDPDGNELLPTHDDGREACWSLGQDAVSRLTASSGLIWKRRVGGWVPYTREYAPDSPRRPYPSIWTDLHTTRQAKALLKEALPGVPEFPTPKPENVIERILFLSTNEGDWVLDSFAGSGTTAAVASQMNRRWVTTEQGEHARTHCLPRLEKVRLGAAPYKFAAGGGFVFEEVGPPLVVHDDALGIARMNPAYVNGAYQRAVCLQTGFRHRPGDPVLHGRAGADGGRFCHVAARGLLVTDEYLAPIRQALDARAHLNGSDTATCVVYATKTATDGGEGVEVLRIPAAFGRARKNGTDGGRGA